MVKNPEAIASFAMQLKKNMENRFCMQDCFLKIHHLLNQLECWLGPEVDIYT